MAVSANVYKTTKRDSAGSYLLCDNIGQMGWRELIRLTDLS